MKDIQWTIAIVFFVMAFILIGGLIAGFESLQDWQSFAEKNTPGERVDGIKKAKRVIWGTLIAMVVLAIGTALLLRKYPPQ